MKDRITLAEYGEDMCTLAKGMTEKERWRYDDEALLEKIVKLGDLCVSDTDWPELKQLLNVFDVAKQPSVTKTSVKKAGLPVVVNLDGESEDELEEESKYNALIAFDQSRGCISHDNAPNSNSGNCPIHGTTRQ